MNLKISFLFCYLSIALPFLRCYADEAKPTTLVKCGSYLAYVDGANVEATLTKLTDGKFKFEFKYTGGGAPRPGIKPPPNPSFSMNMEPCQYETQNTMLFACTGVDKTTDIRSVIEEFVGGKNLTIHIEKGKSKTSHIFNLKKNECQTGI